MLNLQTHLVILVSPHWYFIAPCSIVVLEYIYYLAIQIPWNDYFALLNWLFLVWRVGVLQKNDLRINAGWVVHYNSIYFINFLQVELFLSLFFVSLRDNRFSTSRKAKHKVIWVCVHMLLFKDSNNSGLP